MRSNQEQTIGLLQLIQAAGKLHHVNLQLRENLADRIMEVTGYQHAENVSMVYVDEKGGYDLWVDGDLNFTDLSLDDAAALIADAYMETKARFVITNTMGLEPIVAERILTDPAERAWFFGEMDAGSDTNRDKIEKRSTN